MAAVLVPSATRSPLIPLAIVICKVKGVKCFYISDLPVQAIMLDVKSSRGAMALSKTVLALCTACIQPRAPPKFDL